MEFFDANAACLKMPLNGCQAENLVGAHIENRNHVEDGAFILSRRLYAIEAEIRGKDASIRQTVRVERSRPLVDELANFLRAQAARLSGRGEMGKAIAYLLNHWEGLTAFLEDGRIEMDTNLVENQIRPLTLTRKNALFAGHDEGASYCSSGDILIDQEALGAGFQISGAVDASRRLRGGRRPSARRRGGLSVAPRSIVAGQGLRRW